MATARPTSREVCRALGPVALAVLSACTDTSPDAARTTEAGTTNTDSATPSSGGTSNETGGSTSAGRSGTGGTRAAGGAAGAGASGGARASGGAGSGGGPESGGTRGAGGSATAGAGSSGAPSGGAPSGGAPGVAEVRVVGRSDGDPKSPRFEWSSVSIQARFKGTSVQADLDGGNNNYFEVIVDGQRKPRIATTTGRRKVPVVSGLPDTEHDLVLWRRTEANTSSPSQFFGLDLGGGTLLPIAAPAHKLEIVGDSITCGYGNEGAGPNCGFSYDTENSYLSYGAVAARELGADLYTECWSGKGMYRNYGGDMNETLPTLFKRTRPTDAASTWNFKWTPDAVVINLGTNDFSTGDPGQPFLNAYEAFVADLRTHYPNAYIFLIDGPMMSGDPLNIARGYLDDVIQARKDAGDARVQQVLIDPQDQAKNGIGCDYHPSVATDDVVGKKLAAAIKTTMGW